MTEFKVGDRVVVKGAPTYAPLMEGHYGHVVGVVPFHPLSGTELFRVEITGHIKGRLELDGYDLAIYRWLAANNPHPLPPWQLEHID